MESSNLDAKYHKLATEYSKLRAQAGVLKKAVIDEQNKNSTLREQLRQKETALRRTEQEVDSISFRNKQLEHRVASLQDDIEKECSKKSNQKFQKFHKLQLTTKLHSNNTSNNGINNTQNNDIKATLSGTSTSSSTSCLSNDDTIIVEELQKKILENARLTSLIDDKNREITLHSDRIKELEKQIEKRNLDSIELERRLRKEIDTLNARNSELETKLVEAASMMGSEDALSASDSDNTPLHSNSTSNEERIAFLEKELFHWRTQYEILKIGDCDGGDTSFDRNKEILQNGPINMLSSSLSVNDNKLLNDNHKDHMPKEQILYDHLSKKFDELLRSKCMAESKLTSYLIECEHLQSSMDLLTKELNDKQKELKDSSEIIQTLEEDLATTRINYEEQISVLTEQVISLSEQLASLK